MSEVTQQKIWRKHSAVSISTASKQDSLYNQTKLAELTELNANGANCAYGANEANWPNRANVPLVWVKKQEKNDEANTDRL